MNAIQLNNPKVAEICRKNDVSELSLFGSFARGAERDDSDVDLLARFSRPKSLLVAIAVERQLSDAIGRKVDLVTEAALSPILRERISKSLRTIYHAG